MRSLAEIQQQLSTSPDSGLSAEAVAKSRAQFGGNHLTPLLRQPLWQKFLEKFDEPIIKILLAAALLSMVVDLFKPPFDSDRYLIAGITVGINVVAIIGAFIFVRGWMPALLFLSALILFPVGLAVGHASYDGLAVMIAVILATGVAFLSEYKSDREFEILNAQKESIEVKVIRDGAIRTIMLEDVVVGDVVVLEMGDEIPADGRLIKANELYLDQSLMTGESEPVRKHASPQRQQGQTTDGPDAPDCLFRGTQVVDGKGTMIVTEVGDATALGEIARHLSAGGEDADTGHKRVQQKLSVSKELTPLQHKLEKLARIISRVGYVAAVAIFLALLIRGLVTGEVRWPSSSGNLSLTGHANPVSDMVFSPDGKLLASVSWTVSGEDLVGEVKLWDVERGHELRSLRGHQDLISCLAFSPNGKYLATGGKEADAAIILWDVASGKELRLLGSAPPGKNAKAGHAKAITALSFDAQGRRLVSASLDGTAKVWDVATGALVCTYLGHGANEVLAVAFQPGGKLIASGGQDRLIHIWEADSGTHRDFLPFGVNPIAQLQYSPDGTLLAATATKKSGNDPLLHWYVQVTDTETRKKVNQLDIPHRGAGLTMAFVDRRHLALHTDGPVTLWKVDDGQTHDFSHLAHGPAFTLDGQRSAWLGPSGQILLAQGTWETALASGSALLSYFMYMVIIIVVAVPEGLPMSVTVSLALAMRKMTRANALVRQLVACETIGSATVICSDKTGTLTQNKMRLVQLCWDGEFFTPNEIADPGLQIADLTNQSAIRNLQSAIVLNAAVNSTANLETRDGTLVAIGNSTEGALLHWLHDARLDYRKLRSQFDALYQMHFSSERKRMTTVIRVGTSLVALVKGAPELLLEHCRHYQSADGTVAPMTDTARAGIIDLLRDAAGQAMRTLAFAYAYLPKDQAADEDSLHATRDTIEKDLIYVGFAAIRDPLRDDVKQAIAECRDAGIAVKMITGDNVETARAIGAEIGLLAPLSPAVQDERITRGVRGGGEGLGVRGPRDPIVMTSDEFNRLSDDELKEKLPRLTILARARPLDKYRMVRLLQEQGEVVAVTGDGTNDAPALKKADVGLAMGRAGTEVAKEASKIVILDDSFATIVNAVHWGRALYENIQRFIQFQLTINISALVIAFLGPFFGVKPPFTILQLLWINVIMDTLASIALCSEPPRAGLMKQKPKRKDDSILTPQMLTTIFTTAGFFVIVMLLLLLGLENHWPFLDDPFGTPSRSFPELTYWQVALFFSVYVFFQVWNEINCRSLSPEVSGFHRLFRNWVFLSIVGLIVVVQIVIVSVGGQVFEVAPLGPWTWLAVIVATSSVVVYAEIVRQIRLARLHESATANHRHDVIEYEERPRHSGDTDGRFERRPPGRGE